MYFKLPFLKNKSAAELNTILSAIPANTEILDMTDCGLSSNTIILVFKAVPVSVWKLILVGNCLFTFPLNILTEAFGALPKSLIEIDLSENALNYKNNQDLTLLFSLFPSGVRSLKLASNYISMMNTTLLCNGLKEVAKNITRLDLTNNNLNLETMLIILKTFTNVIHLKLSVNRFTSNGLLQIFEALPISLTHLYLNNCIYLDTHLVTASKKLHANLLFLDISGNNLFHPATLSLLASFFLGLPQNIKELALNSNRIHELQPESIKLLHNTLPFLEKMHLSIHDIELMSLENCRLFSDVFPNIIEVVSEGINNSIIVPSNTKIIIIEKIRLLERKKEPLSLFRQCTLFAYQNGLLKKENTAVISQDLKEKLMLPY